MKEFDKSDKGLESFDISTYRPQTMNDVIGIGSLAVPDGDWEEGQIGRWIIHRTSTEVFVTNFQHRNYPDTYCQIQTVLGKDRTFNLFFVHAGEQESHMPEELVEEISSEHIVPQIIENLHEEASASENALDLTQIRDGVLVDILSGRADAYYSNWMLTGESDQGYNPTYAIAVFPNDEGGVDLHGLALRDDVKEEDEYWRDSAGLVLPERVTSLESFKYISYGNIQETGERILSDMSREVLSPNLPSAVILFNKQKGGMSDTAYLFAPTPIPPSIALKQITELAKKHVESH